MDRRTFLVGAGASAAMMAGQAAAQSSSESGFTSLFDGKTLDGWSVREGPESAFYAKDGDIVIHESAGFPTWLRSARQYENFDFRGEFFIKGWMNSGIYFHAPEHGRNMWCGMKLNIFQDVDAKPAPESMGSIFPLIPPRKVNVKAKGEWNTFRILMDWPRLQVWTNEEMIHDLDVTSVPELRHRLRRGYLGLESMSYANRFRNLRVKELPAKDKWITLYDSPEDLGKWYVSEGKPNFEALGGVLHADGLGYLATKEKFRNFELQMYVRHVLHHNSGVMFRAKTIGPDKRNYEIQLHDVEGAHYPTGSLYHLKRSSYPRIEAEKWWLYQMVVKDRNVLVRINGETVMEYDQLENLEEGSIELQAHQTGRWTEFKEVRVIRHA